MEVIMGNEELFEYETFTLDMNGKEVEFAIIEEFELEGKNYILCSEVVDDEIRDEDLYLFRAKTEGNEIEVESIESEEEYNHIVEEYYKICEAE